MRRSTRASSNARSRWASCGIGWRGWRRWALQPRDELAHFRPDVIALQRHRQICDDEAGLVAAVMADGVHSQRVERLLADELGHRVGQLDLAPGAAFLLIQHPHHLRLEDVAADHAEP